MMAAAHVEEDNRCNARAMMFNIIEILLFFLNNYFTNNI